MRARTFMIVGAVLSLLFALSACKDQSENVKLGKFGAFIGKVVVSWVDNGRDMMLVKKFGYVSPDKKKWEVPPGTITNGASIPSWLWTPIGSPYVGKYRRAAVLHDYYTEIKTRSSNEVNHMFYTAALAGGSSETVAKYMYGALLSFGDSWSAGSGGAAPSAENNKDVTKGSIISIIRSAATSSKASKESTANPAPAAAPRNATPTTSVAPPGLEAPVALQQARQAYLHKMLKWIQTENPTPEQIRDYVNKHKKPGR